MILRVALVVALVGLFVWLVTTGKERQEYVTEGGHRKVVVEWYTYATPEFLEAYAALIKEFERTHPNIKIRINPAMGDTGYEAKLMTMVAGQIAPDLVHVTYNNFPMLTAQGLTEDLTPYVARDREFSLSNYYPVVLDGMRVKGRLNGLPTDWSTIVLFYNKKLFDRYGISYPDMSWDWNKFLWAAKKLTVDTDQDGRIDQFGFHNVAAYNRWPAWVWMAGGEIMSKDGKTCLMDSPEAIRGLQFYVDLSIKEHVCPLPFDATGQSFEQLFQGERCAMIATSRYAYKTFLGLSQKEPVKMPFEWDLAPMPKGPACRATTFIWGGEVIMKSSRHKKEAWEFAKFLSGAEGAKVNVKMGNAIPAFRPVAEDPKTVPAGAPKNDRCFYDALAYARVAPNPPQYSEFVEAQRKLGEAWLAQKKPDGSWTSLSPPDKACRQFAKDINTSFTGEVW